MHLFTKSETDFKLKQFQKKLVENKTDCALLTANSDLFYFTGSVQKGVLFIPSEGRAVYYVTKNIQRASEESAVEVVPFDKNELKSRLADMPEIGLAFDTTTMSEKLWFEKKILPESVTVTDISFLLMTSKMLKHDSEIERIERAAEINRDIMNFVVEIYKPGMTDIDVQSEIDSHAKRDLGHQQLFYLRGKNMFAGMSLVVGDKSGLEPTYTDFPVGGKGPNSSVAQGPCGEKIKNSFLVDFLGAVDGYTADSTRTFFINEPGEKIKKIYRELNEVVRFIVSLSEKEMSSGEIYRETIEHIKRYSWEEGFMGLSQKVPFFGHGIGSEVNQLPIMAPKQKTKLTENMVVAIEPKIFVPDYGIVGVEDTWLFKNGKMKSLTGNAENMENFVINAQI
ncbi:MAG: Xaa-Pro peptidase family protein [bacterium]